MKFCKSAFLSSLLIALALGACSSESPSSNQTDTESIQKTENETVLVTGITGNQGGGVANAALELGFNVRGLSRNISSDTSKAWIERGVTMVQGDFSDYDSIKSAVAGVDHLFLNITEQTPNFVDAANHTIDAANTAGVKHIVFTSNRPADPDGGFVIETPDHKRSIELHLRQSGYSYTTLRIPFMMENLMRDRDMQTLITQGMIDYGDETTPGYYIISADMGRIAAAAFSDPNSWNGREVNLAGDAVTPKQLVELASELSGIEIEYRNAPWSEMTGRFAANFRWFEEGKPTYDLLQLQEEFPDMLTVDEYFRANNYGEKLRELAAAPVDVQPGGMGAPGGMGGPGGMGAPGGMGGPGGMAGPEGMGAPQ